MNSIIQTLTSKLNENLISSRSLENPLDRLNAIVKDTEEAVFELKNYIQANTFSNDKDEIEFFKIIKPEILSHRVEEGLRYNLIVNKPIGTKEIQVKYFEEELQALQSFFRMNSFHYQYYKNRVSELDTLFFLRNSGPLAVPVIDVIIDAEAEFSTPVSYIFTKFIAYENIQYFILQQIADIQNEGKLTYSTNAPTTLKWTGDVINIVELAYGIWLTGQLNYGNASLNQIVRWLEANFQVSIGIVQRKFTEIEGRKRLSTTKFLDQMRDMLLDKINKANE
jgi:hypothetical protein